MEPLTVAPLKDQILVVQILTNTSFKGCDLTNVRFEGANLTRTKLTSVGLKNISFKSCVLDYNGFYLFRFVRSMFR